MKANCITQKKTNIDSYNLRSKTIIKCLKKKNKIQNHDKLNFLNITISPKEFIIEDVLGDNACFYRCISNILYIYNCNINNIDDNVFNTNNYTGISFGYYSEQQDILARNIQNEIVKWNFENRNREIQELSLQVKDLVISTHDMFPNYIVDNIDENNISEELMLEYYKRYSIFAGDDTGDKGEYDRWGGACEQYAISEILKTPIYIYMAKKINEKYNRIENGKIRNNKAEKNVRLQLYQTFGEKYKNNNNGIHILYKNTKNCQGHYMCLYTK
jgi:hypothetical protein